MPWIVAVVGQKGGVGKTTISASLAGEWVRQGRRVLLVDADPQASTQEWFVASEDGEGWPRVIGCSTPIMHKPGQLRAMDEYDVIVIDGPPQDDALTSSALLSADVAILPVSPSGLDIRAISRTVALCEDAKAFNEGLRTFLLVNRKQPGTVIGRRVRRALQGESLEDFPLLETEITQRVSLAEVPGTGLLIQHYDPQGKSVKEFQRLAKEIERHVRS